MTDIEKEYNDKLYYYYTKESHTLEITGKNSKV